MGYEGVVLHLVVDLMQPAAGILKVPARNQVVRQKVELKQLVSEVQPLADNAPYRAVVGFGYLHVGSSCGEESASAQVRLVVSGQDGVVVERDGALDEQAVEACAVVATAAWVIADVQRVWGQVRSEVDHPGKFGVFVEVSDSSVEPQRISVQAARYDRHSVYCNRMPVTLAEPVHR